MVRPLYLIEWRVELIQGDQGLGIAIVAAQKAEVPVIVVDNSQETIKKGVNFAGPFCHSFSCPFIRQ